ncbi:MAG: glycosyltransferase family 39 protein [Candidatus Aenigmarchaeota archaeon]|nr:glycosyltransferase family 39 protein [Candidatus Aenigmarchaeota archaeon]
MEIEIKIDEKIIKNAYYTFIILFFLIFSFLIFYNNLSVVWNYPIVFGDEGYHMRISKEFALRKEYLHYLDFIQPNPSAYGYISIFHFLEAFGFLISESFAKFLLPLIIFVTSFSIFVIFWKIFDEKIALLSSILFQTFQSTIIYSVTFYVDSLFVLFIFLSFSFLFLFLKENKIEYYFLSSIFLGLSFIVKPTLPFAISFGIIFLVFYYYFLRKINFKELLMFFLFPIFTILSLIVFNILAYNKICVGFWIIAEFLNKYLDGSCEIKNIEYKDIYSFAGRTEQRGSELDVFSFGLKEYIDFAYGYSSFIILSSIIGIFILIYHKRYELLFPLIPFFLLTVVWLIIIYPFSNDLGVLYRAEDTARYLYFLNPFIALYSSLFLYSLKEILDLIKNARNSSIVKVVFLLIFLISLFIITYYFFISYSFKLEIMKRVKTFSEYFFEACEYIKERTEKNTTLMSLWGYRVLYACERNIGGTADLRLSNSSTFINELAKNFGIDYFFVEKFSIDPLNRNLSEMYNLDWVKLLLNSKEYFEIFYENGVPIDDCINNYLPIGIPCDGVIIFKIK